MKKNKDAKSNIVREELRESEGISYRYLLTVNSSSRVASYRMPLYSIKVEMREGENFSENEIKDIFADVGKAITFFDKMVENLVTPIDLPYVLEDRISVW